MPLGIEDAVSRTEQKRRVNHPQDSSQHRDSIVCEYTSLCRVDSTLSTAVLMTQHRPAQSVVRTRMLGHGVTGVATDFLFMGLRMDQQRSTLS